MKKKICRISIVILLIFSMVTVNTDSSYASGLGGLLAIGTAAETATAGGAVGILAGSGAVIPMILIALGVIGISEILTNDTIMNEIENAIGEFTYKAKDRTGEFKEYIKGVYKDGKTYFSETLLEQISWILINNGVFEAPAEETGLVNSYDDIDFTGISTDVSTELSKYAYPLKFGVNQDFTLRYYWSGWKNGSYKILSHTADVYTIWIKIGTRSIDVYSVSREPFSVLRGFHGDYTIHSTNNSFSYVHETLQYGSTHVDSNKDNTISITPDFVNSYVSGYPSGWQLSSESLIWACLNFGVIESDGYDFTDNIPLEAEGVLTLPDWEGLVVDVSGDAYYPVEIPEGTVPVIYPIDYDGELPDVIDVPAVDVPEDGTLDQGDVQEGTYEDIVSDPVFQDATADSFMVPESIKEKFPFCIPFDAVKVIRGLNTAGSAPVFTWDYNIIGQQGQVVIDLSIFDTTAQIFRSCFLVIFIIGLILGTKEVIK